MTVHIQWACAMVAGYDLRPRMVDANCAAEVEASLSSRRAHGDCCGLIVAVPTWQGGTANCTRVRGHAPPHMCVLAGRTYIRWTEG